MGKSKRKNKTNYIVVIAGIIAIVAAILYLTLPITRYSFTIGKEEVSATFGGFSMIFGGRKTLLEDLVYGITVKETSANLGAIIALLLPLVGGFVAILSQFVKPLKTKSVVLVSGLLMIIGAILMLFSKNFAVSSLEVSEKLREYYTLGIGAIISAILSIGSGVTIIAKSTK